MTESELQEEAGILSLACGQLGNDLANFGAQLAQGKLNVLEHVHGQFPAVAEGFGKQLSVLMRKYERIQAETRALKERDAPKPNGHAEESIQGGASPA